MKPVNFLKSDDNSDIVKLAFDDILSLLEFESTITTYLLLDVADWIYVYNTEAKAEPDVISYYGIVIIVEFILKV